ncbi:SIMPL domain-containing protein [Salinibacter grassmerensis]|uniref:SIMPL domain-containing protein n=1 Tax=Salinibacter grassmerensis TaxID=3040353 RepID=UPI0021E78641|nr:SIMPL domain-containing protein [Salinibacter grassmerensis]
MSCHVRSFWLVVFAAFFAVAGPVAAQDDDRSTVSVSGEGTVTAQPDQAVVRFGVVTRAATAEQARSQNASSAKDALNAVRALDVPDEKMRMERLRLQPRYEYNDEKNQRERVGYEATRQVVVELDRLELLPQLVADIVNSGANRVDNIDYQLSDRTQFRNEALREAARAAREKARLLSETLDARLGAVRTINEQSFDFVRPQPRVARMEMAKTTSTGQEEPEAYAAGEIEVSAQVQVTFGLLTGSDR